MISVERVSKQAASFVRNSFIKGKAIAGK